MPYPIVPTLLADEPAQLLYSSSPYPRRAPKHIIDPTFLWAPPPTRLFKWAGYSYS